jgi:hypothetical protein
MAAIFQIRRGTTNITPQEGELYLHQRSGSLQFGSGSKSYNVLTLDAPVNGDINLTGNITASNAYISGNLHISGNLILGNSGSDTITATGEFTSNLIPNPTDTYNLGSDTKRWGRMFVNSISASSFTGSLYGMGDPTSFSTSVDLRLDRVEASASLYDNAMSGSNRLYVSPSGSDSNDGSDPSVPFRTIKAAVQSLGVAEYTNTKRYTIFVGSGEYTEQNPIALPPGVAIVGDTLRTVRLTAANPTKDYFHCHDGNYFYGLRFLNLRNPSFSFSYPCSTANTTISGGSITAISVVHSMTGYTDGNNQDLGIIIEGPDASGSIATATANVAGGVITQINVVSGGTNYSATEKPHISIPAPIAQRPIIGTSPYIQNCSSITGPFTTDGTLLSLIPGNANYAALPYNINDVRNQSNAVIGSGVIDEQGAGGGIRIDGNLVHPSSPLESFVADAFTQVNQGGPGHLVINKGYAQFVSCFTTFCTYGFKVVNGGFANISNSVIDFGTKGLVSKTYFPQTYNTGSSLETLSSYVTSAEILQDGAGYTGSIASVTISGGGGTGAIATASVNVFGSIDDIVITNSGSGYTSEPNLTIATPTGANPIPATVVGGKANISGIPSIKFELQSGSRGVDVSSNMILNGIDYLVTSVATGSNGNERYVSTYPSPPSVTTGDKVYFHQLSNISTGGLVMEYVGSGVTYNALPKFGGVPNRNREITEYAPGRVFYSTVDNIGNVKIGDFFAVNQLTGEVTIDARSFNLSGINNIGPFKRNGVAVGVVLQEVSNNTTLLDSQFQYGETTVPTQYAVKGYIDVRDNRLNNLESTSASVNGHISDINTYTASLKTAIDVTGGNTRILGNLIVDGTQTSLNTSETFIEDKSITLASGSTTSAISDGAGFNIAGANVSMSWEHSNTRFGINTNLGIVGSISSSTIVGLNGDSVTTYSTSVDSRIVSLSNTSTTSTTRLSRIEESTASLNTFSASTNAHIVDINTKTGSFESKFVTLGLYTGSIDTKWETLLNVTASVLSATASLNTFSASALTRLSRIEESTSSLNTFSASVNGHITDINTKTGSFESKFNAIGYATSSLNTFSASMDAFYNNFTTSLANGGFSASIDYRLDEVEYTASLFGGGLVAQLDKINQATASLQSFTASVAGTNAFTSSANSRLNNIEAVTSSYETTGRGIVSGSSQVTLLLPTGVVSGSSQVLNSSNVLSGSNQTYITTINQNLGTTSSGVQFATLGIGTAPDATYELKVEGDIAASGDIVAYNTSDKRLKNNIEPIVNALDKLNQLGGYTFEWNEELQKARSGKDLGVIAQEVQSVFPEVVIERENGYLAVDYEKLVPVLIEAIKELSTKITELEKK